MGYQSKTLFLLSSLMFSFSWCLSASEPANPMVYTIPEQIQSIIFARESVNDFYQNALTDLKADNLVTPRNYPRGIEAVNAVQGYYTVDFVIDRRSYGGIMASKDKIDDQESSENFVMPIGENIFIWGNKLSLQGLLWPRGHLIFFAIATLAVAGIVWRKSGKDKLINVWLLAIPCIFTFYVINTAPGIFYTPSFRAAQLAVDKNFDQNSPRRFECPEYQRLELNLFQYIYRTGAVDRIPVSREATIVPLKPNFYLVEYRKYMLLGSFATLVFWFLLAVQYCVVGRMFYLAWKSDSAK